MNQKEFEALCDRIANGSDEVPKGISGEQGQIIARIKARRVVTEGPVAPLDDVQPDPDPNPAPDLKEKAPAKRRSIKPVLPLRRKK